MHVLTIVYVYTSITVIEYVYYVWVLLGFSFIMWTVSVLGYKTAKTINQSCKR